MIRELARALVRRLFGCRHHNLVRERRTKYGCEIAHFVCDDCGFVTPILARSEQETRALFDKMTTEAAGERGEAPASFGTTHDPAAQGAANHG